MVSFFVKLAPGSLTLSVFVGEVVDEPDNDAENVGEGVIADGDELAEPRLNEAVTVED